MQRLVPAPAEPLFGVVGRPHVEGRERVHAARVGDREVAGHLGPGADAHAVGLLDGGARGEGVQRRLAVAPDALLERPAQLGLVGLAHEIARLVVEGGVQEEALVGEPEGLAGLADAALAEGYELLAFRQGADGDSPFFESNWHEKNED